jgi:ketosteroid isomerase-like protein
VEIGQTEGATAGGSQLTALRWRNTTVVPLHLSALLCENFADFHGGLNDQTYPYRFAVHAHPHSVCVGANQIGDEKIRCRPDNVAMYYASGTHTFFDIAPLKYSSWDEYDKGVKSVIAGYKSAKFTINDDLAVHPNGDLVWATATVNEQMIEKSGKVDMGAFRWTVVWEAVDGKWQIVHEHVSAPLQ